MHKLFLTAALLFLKASFGFSQTDLDAIMMNKKQLCVGVNTTYSSWTQYWQGDLKRENLNLGTVATQSITLGVDYGITKWANVLVSVPYVKTTASAGTLKGLEGFQDASLYGKIRFYQRKKNQTILGLHLITGVSTPISNYVVDALPLSIGLGSTNITHRLMADYEYHHFFVTASWSYIWRSKVTIDKVSYYTTQMVYSNQVAVPNATQYNIRAGYRVNDKILAELMLNQFAAVEGFDIPQNLMPFLSNKTEQTSLGFNVKYNTWFAPDLALIAQANFTVAGRNTGQANSYGMAAFYLLRFTHKKK